jgi:hypothetical protein
VIAWGRKSIFLNLHWHLPLSLRRMGWGIPVYCPHGVRHEGSMTLLWASVRNVGTGRSDVKGEALVGGPHEGESTDAEHRDGLPRSSREVPVMGMERRGQVTRLALVANR